uniref:Uncharacterized protein n=1 Tax=Anguilla anguilla TaxID=7936 RepID=A0A0E9RW45_ANGAN
MRALHCVIKDFTLWYKGHYSAYCASGKNLF